MTHPHTAVIANNPDAYPRRIIIVAASRVVARHVFTIDWGMPASMGKRLRIIGNEPYEFKGMQPDVAPLGDVLWFAPDYLKLSLATRDEIMILSRTRGWQVKHFFEFPTYWDPRREALKGPLHG